MRQLGIFAKYWQPGHVKTRLATGIGDGLASRVYQFCLSCLLERLSDFPDARSLWYAPPERQREFEQLAGGRYMCIPQGRGDLGARIHRYFTAALGEPQSRAVLVGSDSPNLPRAWIDQAFAALHEYDVVLGPSDDGGYWLVGMRGQVAPIFADIPWSTPEVWDATCRRLTALNATWTALPAWYDVDDEPSLARLRRELAERADDPPLERLRDQLNALLPPSSAG